MKFRTFGGRTWRAVTIAGATAALAFPLASIGASAAGASPAHNSGRVAAMAAHAVKAAVHADGSASCGTAQGPPANLPAGTYTSLTVPGTCFVDEGRVTVTGNATVLGSGALGAIFAHNSAGPGVSSLTVDGNVLIDPGGTAFLGCGPAFPCQDAGGNPNLIGKVIVDGSVLANQPLGVIVHNATIDGDVTETGGGGGNRLLTPACLSNPSLYLGVFGAVGAPVYSDFEDNVFGGNLRVTGVHSCWLGTLRDHIAGSVTSAGNLMGDPDANEVLTNHVGGNLICEGDSPAPQFGDSSTEFPSTGSIVTGYAIGQCSFTTMADNPAADPSDSFKPGPAEHLAVPSGIHTGYTMAASDGGTFPMGAPFLGSAATEPAATPYVGIGTNPGGLGYDVANANGGVDALGAGALLGLPGPPASAANSPTLNKPVVGVAAVPGGDGYWTAAGDGGVFQNGSNAGFFGSLGSIHLNRSVVGIAPAPDGRGYYLVAGDGGIFPLGPGTTFAGSLGSIHLNAPAVGIAVDPATGGYWIVAADGGVFPFNAPYLGSLGNIHLNKPIVGIVAAPTGNGYYLVAADGGVFPFGPGTHFQGSLGNVALNAPVVGMGLG